jgi:hypothetical protein
MLKEVNAEVNAICKARDDVHSLLRFETVLGDETKAEAILANAKARANTAAASIVTLTAAE